MIVYERLAYLEKLIEESKKIPLSDKVSLDKVEALEIIKEIKSALPDELKQAKWIAEERKKIIVKAHMESDAIIKEAEEKVSEHEMVKKAQEHANKLLEAANIEAKQIKKGSREYADSLFNTVQERIDEITNIIREAKDDLKE